MLDTTAHWGGKGEAWCCLFIVPSVSLILIIEAYITLVDDEGFPPSLLFLPGSLPKDGSYFIVHVCPAGGFERVFSSVVLSIQWT